MKKINTRKLINDYINDCLNLIDILNEIPVEQVFLFHQEFKKTTEILNLKYSLLEEIGNNEIKKNTQEKFFSKLYKAKDRVDEYMLKIIIERDDISSQKLTDGTYVTKGIIIPFEYLKEKYYL